GILLPDVLMSANQNTRFACLMQTTLSVTETRMITETLRRYFPDIEIPENNICYATQNRQEAVRQLAGQSDIVLVVGSSNSSNSRRLQEIAEQQGIPAKLIDGEDEIDLQWFSGRETVTITAGTSAPEHIVQACVERLRRAFHGRKSGSNTAGRIGPDSGSVDVEEVVICKENVVFPLPTELQEYTPTN
ncbi:MAG: hypothetical protein FWD31_15250, partial [Planctomycetaceae bacterium]|nr:hypothetical protein [Planctomycetaceae bacterium]